jgi:hypothetical protein
MTVAYHPEAPRADDYRSLRVNGMWYQSWQSGYHDILKRGFPRPLDGRTILAELHSPNVPDFMHGGASGEVPFLVSVKARTVLEQHQIAGLEFAPVQVAKIATKGKRQRSPRAGEPEDAILKARGVSLQLAPTLFAAYVVGRVTALPEHESGRHPTNVVAPFELAPPEEPCDIWRPQYDGKPFSAWVFCSSKFKAVCEEASLSNIAFVPFESFMGAFRMAANKQLQPTPNCNAASRGWRSPGRG